METRTLSAVVGADVSVAADILRGGGLVAFPTETVYGLGARADLPEAVQALLAVKGRPAEKRMAVLVSGVADAVRLAGSLGAAARALAEKFWPGPVTVVVPAPDGETLGLRCPEPQATRRLVRETGAPVFAPSANPTGKPPARSAREVLDYFEGRIDAVLDGGEATFGVGSTVVLVEPDGVRVLREGAVSAQEIRRALRGE
jgi:L-threonylcarbamoyladenylate synthase